MAWAYDYTSPGDPGSATNWIVSKLNGLTPLQQAGAKVAASDAKGRPSHGIVFYDGNPLDPAQNPNTLTGGWTSQSWPVSRESDWGNALASAAAQLNKISPIQALYAKVSASDAYKENGWVTVFWQQPT